jgi:hypothetical protein
MLSTSLPHTHELIDVFVCIKAAHTAALVRRQARCSNVAILGLLIRPPYRPKDDGKVLLRNGMAGGDCLGFFHFRFFKARVC